MNAAWYEQFGTAAEVLAIGELEDPQPGPGEVLVRLRASAVNSSDVKKRAGWLQHRVAHVLGLDEIAKAHELIEKGGFRGCVVIRP